MNSDDEYYIPEEIEDDFLRSVAAMAIKVLKENDLLEDILQKYMVAYNKVLKESCSAKSLKVMNQNHKLIFSTITSSGVIKSPRCSSVSAKKDAKVPCIINHQLRTPLKTNRINSRTERKRLSFDVTENECMNPVNVFTGNSYECQMSLDTNSSFFKYEHEAKLYDSPEGRINLDGIPLSVDTLSMYDQVAANLSAIPPDKNQTMVISPEKKNRIPVDSIVEGKRNAWYFECRPSLFSYDIIPKASNSPDTYIKERFNLEGKPETMTSSEAIYYQENANLSKSSPDNHQKIVTSPEKKNGILVNYAIDDRKSARCLANSPSILNSKKEAKVSEKHNKNEQEFFRPEEKHKTASSLPVDQLKNSCTSYKTPEKLQTFTFNADKEERTPINQIAVKNVTVKNAANGKESLSLMKDVKTSNIAEMKKRKSVDYSDEAIMATSLVNGHQKFIVPSEISKLNNEPMLYDEQATILNDISFMNGNNSICSTNESPMDANNSFHSADNSAMDENDSFKRSDNEDFIVDHVVAQSDGKSIRSAVPINNNCETMSVSPAEKSERPTYQASTEQECASLFLPGADQRKAVEVKSDIRNSNYVKTKITSHETKYAESVTNLMQTFSPSVKRSYDNTFRKLMTNGSVDVETISLGKLRLQDKLSKTTTPPRECLISNELSPKPDDSYAVLALKFIRMLKQSKNRFSMYLHLFVEDQHDLRFISAYIEKLAVVMEKISFNDNNEVLINAFDDFAHKGMKLLNKANLWESDIVKDLEVWEDCIQKVNHILQDIKRFRREKMQDMNPKEFQKWEENLRIVNKKANDMTLLREIRRPTIIQFGYELENLIQLFIQSMLVVGLLKHSSRVFFQKA